MFLLHSREALACKCLFLFGGVVMFKLFEIIKQEDAKKLNRLKKELKQTTQCK